MDRIIEFSGNHPFLVSALVLMIFLVVFHEFRRRGQGATSFTAADAVRLINRGAVVVDVREPDAWAAGHIVNSRNHTAAALKDNPELLAKQRKKTLLLVCDNGIASGRSAAELRKAGFEQAFSLRGGLNAWRQENLPVTRAEERQKQKQKAGGRKNDKGAAA